MAHTFDLGGKIVDIGSNFHKTSFKTKNPFS